MPKAPSKIENTIIWYGDSSPVAEGRHAVRRILASTTCSIRQFTANAAPANNQIPTMPPIKTEYGTMPGVAKNIPITAQKTASCVTLGLVNTQYWRHLGIS